MQAVLSPKQMLSVKPWTQSLRVSFWRPWRKRMFKGRKATLGSVSPKRGGIRNEDEVSDERGRLKMNNSD